MSSYVGLIGDSEKMGKGGVRKMAVPAWHDGRYGGVWAKWGGMVTFRR